MCSIWVGFDCAAQRGDQAGVIQPGKIGGVDLEEWPLDRESRIITPFQRSLDIRIRQMIQVAGVASRALPPALKALQEHLPACMAVDLKQLHPW